MVGEHCIPAGADLDVEKGQLGREKIGHRQRPQQPLSVLVQLYHCLSVPAGQHSCQLPALAL